MQKFYITAVHHGTAVFTGYLSFLPRVGEQLSVGSGLFVVKTIRYNIQESFVIPSVALFLEKICDTGKR